MTEIKCINPAAGYGVRWVASAAELPAQLWADCFPPPLEGRWWYEALERAGLEAQFEFLYGLIEASGRPAGIAPAFLMDLPLDLVAPPLAARLLPLLPPLRTQRTLFVGSPCADEGTVGLLPGVALPDVAPPLQDALEDLARRRGASLIVWKDFPAAARPALDALAGRRGLFPVTSFPGTRMSVAGCRTFEDYLGRLSAKNRWGLRRKLKRSHALGALDVTVKQRPTPEELEEIFALFWKTYQHGKVKFERLTPEFFRQIARAEPAWFILLRDPRRQGRLAAFKLFFLAGGRVIHKFIGLDYDYSGDWYLLFRLWEAAVDWALKAGVTEIQSGQTGYSSKFDLGFTPVPLTNYVRHRSRLLHSLLAAVARRVTWATLDDDLGLYLKAHGEPAEPEAGEESARRQAA